MEKRPDHQSDLKLRGRIQFGTAGAGHYKVQVSPKGFSGVSPIVIVQVGNTATVNAKLAVGQESQIIEVQGSTGAGEHRAGHGAGRAHLLANREPSGQWTQLP